MIFRDKTAIRRTEISKPIRIALRDGIVSCEVEVFDYGCGFGDDVRHLTELGIKCGGWDPAHRPEQAQRAAEVVNLAYVVNVIEAPEERANVLRNAWGFSKNVLIVAARLKTDQEPDFERFEDGCITRLGTFQKFYEQHELRNWINSTLGQSAIAAAPGVFYVFRHTLAREAFLASRFRRRVCTPRITRSENLFRDNESLLRSLMEFVGDRGRLPEAEELSTYEPICSIFGSTRRAFQVIRRVTGYEKWEEIRQERRNDLLVYVALGKFAKRPKFSDLPLDLRRDIKSFFRNYTNACAEGDRLLFAAGNCGVVNGACAKASAGKLMPTALYVHVSGLTHLPELLRVYEGCARVLAGTVEGATVLKLGRHEPKVSYLVYPEFDENPHPRLLRSIKVELRSLNVRSREYSDPANSPILHRKEDLVTADYPLRDIFCALTAAEEEAGLYAQPERIGIQSAWDELLKSRGLAYDGHSIVCA